MILDCINAFSRNVAQDCNAGHHGSLWLHDVVSYHISIIVLKHLSLICRSSIRPAFEIRKSACNKQELYVCVMLCSIFYRSLSLSLYFFEMSTNLRLYYSRDCRKISRLPFSISWLEVCRRAQWLSSHLQGIQSRDGLEGASAQSLPMWNTSHFLDFIMVCCSD